MGTHNVVLDVGGWEDGTKCLGGQADVEIRCWPHGAQKTPLNPGGVPHCQRVPRHGGGDVNPSRQQTAAKLNIEVTQHHHLVNKGHNFQATKHEQMKGVLDKSVIHIYGCIGQHHHQMLANNHHETS